MFRPHHSYHDTAFYISPPFYWFDTCTVTTNFFREFTCLTCKISCVSATESSRFTRNGSLNKFSLFSYKIKTLFKVRNENISLKCCLSLKTTFSHLSGSI